MQYQGGKHYSAKDIAKVLATYLKPGVDYYEPFCGALHATLAVEPYVQGNIYLSDRFQDLIDLWVAVRDGFAMHSVTREEYATLRSSPPSPARTAAGFGLSFSGKWFGSFTPDRPQHGIYPLQALNRSFERRRPLLKKSTLSCCNYDEIRPKPGDLVYCDPPYAGTTQYSSVGNFDSERFWDWVREISLNDVNVVVSEYTAPPDFTSIWSKSVQSKIKTSAHHVPGVSIYATEHLWTCQRPNRV